MRFHISEITDIILKNAWIGLPSSSDGKKGGE